MRRTALLGALSLTTALLAACGHHGGASPAGSSAAGIVPSTATTGATGSSSSRPGTTASPSGATTSAGSPGAGSPSRADTSAGTSGTATTAAPPAGSATSAQGLDRPVGGFAAVRGISGVTTDGGLVSGFSDTFGAAVPLATATAQLSAYLPAGTSYGAATTAGACHTVQLIGSRHPSDVAFCSETSAGRGSATYTASSIAEVTVSADPGLG